MQPGDKVFGKAHPGRVCSHLKVNDGSMWGLDALSAGSHTADSSTVTDHTCAVRRAGSQGERAFFAQAGTS